jgi:hypothetical protein
MNLITFVKTFILERPGRSDLARTVASTARRVTLVLPSARASRAGSCLSRKNVMG